MENEKKEEKKLSMKDLIILTFEMISARCWARLGLTQDEYGDFYQDLEEVKLGIDTLDGIYNALKPSLDEKMRLELEGIISNLKLNYVHQYQKGKEKEEG